MGFISFPEIRILTSEGVSDIDDCCHLPLFAHDNPFDQATTVIGNNSYPGFARPQPTDQIAVLLAESRGGVPDLWFQKVIDNNYSSGLRFFTRCADLSDIADSDGGPVRSVLFYSSDDAEHFAALVEDPAMDSDAVVS